MPRSIFAIVVTVLLFACSAQTPTPIAAQQPPAPAEPIASSPKSEALEKADRLIAEMRAREAAQAQAATVSAADEATWKRRMHTLQVTFIENIDRGHAALARAEAARQRKDFDEVDRLIAEAERYKNAAATAQAAIDQLRADGQRANIPPGWLRWPQ